MAPVSGYWGEVTSTIDWCEDNYVVLPFIAEFWNTISNIIMIIPPFIGAVLVYRQKMESPIFWCHVGLLSVGIGSWMFHMTLLYSMQLLDELPMIWASIPLIYAYATVSSPPKYTNVPVLAGLILYTLIVTVIYLSNKNPLFHEVAYGLMVFVITSCGFRAALTLPSNTMLFLASCLSYGLGFVLWNIDNNLCGHLKYARQNMLGNVVGAVTQLHAWWHILAGIGTYLSILFVSHTRYMCLKKGPKIQNFLGFAPYVSINNKSR